MKKFFFLGLLFCCQIGITKAQTINNNGTPVDFRIYSGMSQSQVADLIKTAPLEIKKLNYYYSSSYFLQPSTKPGAPKLDPNSVNVRNYENQRLENERKTIVINANEDKIILLSKKELEAGYSTLK